MNVEQPLRLEAGGVRLVLGAALAGYGLEQLAADGAVFAGRGGTLWEVVFRTRQGRLVTRSNRSPSRRRHEWQEDGAGRRLLLRWQGIRLGRGLGSAWVQVELAARAGVPWLCAWIEVGLSGQQVGIWEVRFPTFSGMVAGPQEYAVAPAGWGKVFRAGGKSWESDYPGHWCAMQMEAFVASGHFLCLAALDPEAHTKRLALRCDRGPGLAAIFAHYPEGMGEPGRGYRLPYPVALAAGRGDWYQAARRYREWALQQKWCPGRHLAERPEVSPRCKRLVAWVRLHREPETVARQAAQCADCFGPDTAAHWYEWHQIPFDHTYPEYFPPRPGFRRGVAAARQAGVLVMPYINGRLWDTLAPSWKREEAARFAVKRPEGEVVVEYYASKRPLAVMCPVTRYWQEKVAGIVRRLVGTYRVDGVYIDQIGAAPPVPCFDPSHGHPLGGGHHWVSAYRELVGAISREIKALDPVHFLTTESNGEPFLDLFDAVLMCNSTEEDLVPLFAAVYAGKVLTFGSYLFRPDMERPHAFYMKAAQEFIFGAQVGWMTQEILEQAAAPHRRFLQVLARLRTHLLPWLAFGEMLAPPQSQDPMPNLTDDWLVWGQPVPVTLPAVQASAWQAQEGTVAFAFANAAPEPHTFRLALDRERYRLPPGPLQLTWVDAEGEPTQAAAAAQVAVPVAGHSALALVVGAQP